MNLKYHLGILVHGNLQIGYGHVSRCLTVADEFLRQGHPVTFFIKQGFAFQKELNDAQFRVVSLPDWQPDNIANELTQVDVLLIDVVEADYQDLAWIRAKHPDLLLATITLFDFSRQARFEHLSFFPNPTVPNGKMIVHNQTSEGFILCQGPWYLTFRQEFANLQKTIHKTATKLLLTMGGSDPFDLTLQCFKAIETIDIEITLILNPLCESYTQIYDLVQRRRQRQLPTRLLEKVDNMALLMTESDVTFLNGGLSRYEACMAQTPFIAISIHEQQYAITQQLAALGVCVNLGVAEQLDSLTILRQTEGLLQNHTLRMEMSEKMKNLFDMDGAKRIYNEITQTRKNF